MGSATRFKASCSKSGGFRECVRVSGPHLSCKSLTACLRDLFDHVSKYGVTTNAWKCQLRKPRFRLSGHVVATSGIAPVSDTVTATRDYPEPCSY